MIENIIKDYGLYIITAETVVIVALLLWHFLSSYNRSDEMRTLEREKQNLTNRLSSTQRDLNKYANAYNQVSLELKQYKNWYAKYCQPNTRREQTSNVVEFDLSQEQNRQVATSQVQYQYLQEANDGKFMRLLSSPEKCYFRTWAEGGVRKYEFCGNVAKALANINAIFDDVCEIEGKRSCATDIENVSSGTLDSELRISSKAKIRLK